MKNLVQFSITTYGFAHWYGHLICYSGNDRLRHDIEGVVASEAEASILNGRDMHGPFCKGDQTTRLRDRDSVIHLGVKLCKALYPHAIMVEGNGLNPDPVYIAPEPYKSQMNKLSKKANDLGWYDGPNGDEVERICEKWETLRDLAIEAMK